MNFEESLSFGQAGESEIANWLRSRGNTVLPIYEKIIDNGKGPQLFLPNNKQLVAPDLMVFKDKFYWVEAKKKTAFTWHRKTKRFVTGIDLRHYKHYLEVREVLQTPLWLFFLHLGGKAKDSPESPSGLYAGEILELKDKENHRHENWGSSGMVYWSINVLRKLDDYPFNKVIRLNEKAA